VPPAVAFEGMSQVTVISIVSVGIIVASVVVGSFFVLQMCDRRKKESAAHRRERHGHPYYGAQAQSLLPTVNFDSLKLINVIGSPSILPSFKLGLGSDWDLNSYKQIDPKNKAICLDFSNRFF